MEKVTKLHRPTEFVSEGAIAIWDEIKRLDLTENVAELEVLGYTIVPPEKVAPVGFTDELREALFDVAERRHGVRPDVNGVNGHTGTPFGTVLSYLLFEDPIFEKVMMNEASLALGHYLLGRNAVLSSLDAFIKGPGSSDLALHCDNINIPPPYPLQTLFSNTNWLLTDYSEDNGSICFVPGTHRYNRPPMPGEGMEQRIPINAPKGSLVIFGSAMWHGAFGRKNPGLRCTIATLLSRPHIRTQERFREDVSPSMLEGKSEQFRTLLGQRVIHGWGAEGTDGNFDLAAHHYD